MRKRNKIFLKIVILIMIFILVFSIKILKSFADVGDFGSDWSDSDWGSSYDSDWGSSYDSDWDYGSSWDDDYSYSYSSSSRSYYGSSTGETALAFFVFMFVMVMIFTYVSRKRNSRSNWFRNNNYINRNIYGGMNNPNRYNTVRRSYKNTTVTRYENPLSTITADNAKNVEQKIIEIDELFNGEEFEAWVKQIFIKLQYAWTDRNWAEIRTFETNELFEQHNTQLNRYIMKKQINVLERVAVNWVKLYKFHRTTEKDVLEVAVNAKMIDYIIDEESGKVISGDKTTAKIRTYKMTFIRTIGVKTQPGKITAKAMNCPNCGGQLSITQAGKCEYCGSIVVVDDHGWALSELEPFNV